MHRSDRRHNKTRTRQYCAPPRADILPVLSSFLAATCSTQCCSLALWILDAKYIREIYFRGFFFTFLGWLALYSDSQGIYRFDSNEVHVFVGLQGRDFLGFPPKFLVLDQGLRKSFLTELVNSVWKNLPICTFFGFKKYLFLGLVNSRENLPFGYFLFKKYNSPFFIYSQLNPLSLRWSTGGFCCLSHGRFRFPRRRPLKDVSSSVPSTIRVGKFLSRQTPGYIFFIRMYIFIFHGCFISDN